MSKKQTLSYADQYAKEVTNMRATLAILQRLAVKMNGLADIPGLVGKDEIKDLRATNAKLAELVQKLSE